MRQARTAARPCSRRHRQGPVDIRHLQTGSLAEGLSETTANDAQPCPALGYTRAESQLDALLDAPRRVLHDQERAERQRQGVPVPLRRVRELAGLEALIARHEISARATALLVDHLG